MANSQQSKQIQSKHKDERPSMNEIQNQVLHFLEIYKQANQRFDNQYPKRNRNPDGKFAKS